MHLHSFWKSNLLYHCFSRRRCGGSIAATFRPAPISIGSVCLGLLLLSVLWTQTLAQNATGASCGVNLAVMDRSQDPANDFYAYANGAWVKTADIPADEDHWSPSDELDKRVNKQMRGLIENAKQGARNKEIQQVVDYYDSYMDEETIETRGLIPLTPTLDHIAAIADRAMLARALGETLRADVDPLNWGDFHTDHLFGLWVAQDLQDPTHNVGYILQGGLGLKDRNDYLSPDSTRAKQYQAHVTAMLRLAGLPEPDTQAARIVALERQIARVHETAVASQDTRKAYNPWKRTDFASKAPGLDWTAYFDGAGLHVDRIIVWQPSTIQGEAMLVTSQPLADWKAWLTFHALDDASIVLPKRFHNEWFKFYNATLKGIKQQKERWEQAVDETNTALGFTVGHLYVDHYFPPESKTQVEQLVQQIRIAFGQHITELKWMADSTKREAQEKLRTLKVGIGYPNQWRDYSGLTVARDDAFGNWLRSELFEYRRNVAKLGQPVDRDEWWMTPQEVNAINLPLQNAVHFPAAILQPPIFDPDRPAVANFAWIGSAIGHEISHSFDTTGANFDSTGRMRNWWSKRDLLQFRKLAARLVREFNAYEPLRGQHVDGKRTNDENIADIGGLSVSYDGWKQSLNGASVPGCNGLSGDQQFFIAYAQRWREKRRPESLLQQVKTDAHAPAQYRAYTARNLNAWYEAFHVNKKDQLYLPEEKRGAIWGQTRRLHGLSETASSPIAREIANILDEWHHAADKGDGDAYFSRFAENGVFLGTDPNERWTLPQFRARFGRLFDGSHAWTYAPRERSITISSEGNIAWFDEKLDSPEYGELRGSGVLVRSNDTWKITLYNLTFVVPNAVVSQIVKMLVHR